MKPTDQPARSPEIVALLVGLLGPGLVAFTGFYLSLLGPRESETVQVGTIALGFVVGAAGLGRYAAKSSWPLWTRPLSLVFLVPASLFGFWYFAIVAACLHGDCL